MNKTFHVGLHIEGTLSQHDSALEGLLCSAGDTLSAAEVREFLTQLKTEFPERELFTTCDNQNEKGYCQGHPAQSDNMVLSQQAEPVCSTCNGFGKELTVYEGGILCRSCKAEPAPVQDEQYPPCDYCGTIPDHHPWHGSGMFNGIDSPHIHACNYCRHKLPARPAQTEQQPVAHVTGAGYSGIDTANPKTEWMEISVLSMPLQGRIPLGAKLYLSPVAQTELIQEINEACATWSEGPLVELLRKAGAALARPAKESGHE